MVIFFVGGSAPPRPILLPPGDLEFVSGEDFELRCQVEVSKDATVAMDWSYQSNEVGSKVEFLRHTGRLFFLNEIL
jgi:hypothetical protein